MTSDDFIIPTAGMVGLPGSCRWLLSAVAIQLLSLFVSLSLNVVPAIVVDEFTRPHQLMSVVIVCSVFSKQPRVTGVTKCTATVITSHSSLSRVLLHSKNPTGMFLGFSTSRLRTATSKLTQTATHYLYLKQHRQAKKGAGDVLDKR